MAKYMLIMRDSDRAIEASKEIPFEQIIEQMGRYNEAMMDAGVLVGGDGLAPADEGFVVDYSQTPPVVTDGPYGETHELFNGFWIIEVATKEDAAEWARRAPLGPGTKMEVRRIPGIEEFPQDNEWIQKEQGWREQLEQR